MKKLLIEIILFTLYASFSFLQAQDTGESYPGKSPELKKLLVIVRSAPFITLDFSGHYNFGVYELSANNNGDFSSAQFTNGENFGVRHGFGGTAMVKMSMNNKGYVRFCLSGSYNNFNSKYSKYNVNQQEAGYADYNVYSLGIGVENNFTPGYKFKPLVGIGVLTSIISGNARVYDDNNEVYRDLKIVPAFRLGLMLYSGLEYLVNNKIGVNCGIKIVHANLWLKDTRESGNPNEIYLNDKRVVPRIPFSGWRQFMWGEMYAGINVYFGISEKDYFIRQSHSSLSSR